jgi:DNA-directed RNA polymerase subunit RPC12/RpoP
MIVICAWCGKKLGEKPPYDDKRVTHGICAKCAKKMEEEAGDDGKTK